MRADARLGPADNQQLIGHIYEAAAVPELWNQVLRRVSAVIGATEGLIATARSEVVLHVVAESSHLMETWQLINERFPAASNERTRRVIRQGNHGFITDVDVFKPDELRRDPLYTDILIPRGYGSGIATSIFVPSGDFIIVNLERPFEAGPFDRSAVARLDALRPHLARATLISARLEMERARAAAQALEVLGLPGAVLGRGGRTMATNGLLNDLMPDVVQDRPSRLALANRTADALLIDAITQAEAVIGATVGSIPIPAREERPPMIVHVLPICGVAHDVFGSAVAMVVITPVVPSEVPTANVIQGLFDLTPAEARLAGIIAAGSQPREAAASLGIAEETARSALKRVFAKTGVGRQADLVALLNGAQVPFRK